MNEVVRTNTENFRAGNFVKILALTCGLCHLGI